MLLLRVDPWRAPFKGIAAAVTALGIFKNIYPADLIFLADQLQHLHDSRIDRLCLVDHLEDALQQLLVGMPLVFIRIDIFIDGTDQSLRKTGVDLLTAGFII